MAPPLIIKELGLKDGILCLGFIPRQTGWGAAAPHTRSSAPAARRSLSGSAPNQTRDILPRIALKKRFFEHFLILLSENFCKNSSSLRPALLTILPLQFFEFFYRLAWYLLHAHRR
jgi:hypothetical protein